MPKLNMTARLRFRKCECPYVTHKKLEMNEIICIHPVKTSGKKDYLYENENQDLCISTFEKDIK